MKIIWLTQGGFLIESGDYRFVIDPYISNYVEKNHKVKRIAKAPFSAGELKPDQIYCTHDHIDHVDPYGLPEILSFSKDCTVAGPESVFNKCIEIGIEKEKLLKTKLNESFDAGPFKITPVKSFHCDNEATGLVIKSEGKIIYVSGDTEFRDELPDIVLKAAGKSIDIAFVCINGKWGNMSYKEAFDVSKEISAVTSIPMHYGLFAENTVNPTAFIDLCNKNGIRSFEMDPGKSFEF